MFHALLEIWPPMLWSQPSIVNVTTTLLPNFDIIPAIVIASYSVWPIRELAEVPVSFILLLLQGNEVQEPRPLAPRCGASVYHCT